MLPKFIPSRKPCGSSDDRAGLAEPTARYDRSSWPIYLPPQWTPHIHPEGQHYFYRHPAPRIVTEAQAYCHTKLPCDGDHELTRGDVGIWSDADLLRIPPSVNEYITPTNTSCSRADRHPVRTTSEDSYFISNVVNNYGTPVIIPSPAPDSSTQTNRSPSGYPPSRSKSNSLNPYASAPLGSVRRPSNLSFATSPRSCLRLDPGEDIPLVVASLSEIRSTIKTVQPIPDLPPAGQYSSEDAPFIELLPDWSSTPPESPLTQNVNVFPLPPDRMTDSPVATRPISSLPLHPLPADSAPRESPPPIPAPSSPIMVVDDSSTIAPSITYPPMPNEGEPTPGNSAIPQGVLRMSRHFTSVPRDAQLQAETAMHLGAREGRDWLKPSLLVAALSLLLTLIGTVVAMLSLLSKKHSTSGS